MVEEFKKFIQRGNVIDLAVGVIIGGAFGKIVTSLVDDILMPVIGLIIGGLDFTNLSFKVNDAVIAYGNFIQNVVDFFIVSICIFFLIRMINRVHPKEEVKKPIPETPKEILLLEEIRDILKKKSK